MSSPKLVYQNSKISNFAYPDKDGILATVEFKVYDDGHVKFIWLNNNVETAQIDCCVGAFFTIAESIPELFSDIGEPDFNKGCASDDMLVWFADAEFPYIGMGFIPANEDAPKIMAVLNRGEVITIIDTISELLSEMDGIEGCAAETDEEEHECNETCEDHTISETEPKQIISNEKDVFSGIDMKTKN